jgi:hypothetical protein
MNKLLIVHHYQFLIWNAAKIMAIKPMQNPSSLNGKKYCKNLPD